MNKFLLLHLLILLSIRLSKAERLPADTIQVVQIAQEEGLSQLGAATMSFDQKGYLWIGTQDGLNRFNGYQMKVFQSSEENHKLPDDHIRSLYYQSDTLWLATNTHGVVAYDMANDYFLTFQSKWDKQQYPNLKYSYVIYPLTAKDLIIGGVGSCMWIDRQTMDFIPVPITEGIKASDFVTSILSLDEQHLVVGTNASGIFLLDIAKKSISSDPIFSVLGNAQINSLYRFSLSKVWIGTNMGLYQYDSDTKLLTRLSKNAIRSLYRWDAHNVLVGGVHRNYLLNSSDGGWRHLVFVNELGKELQSDILSFAVDNQEGRWIGTESRGIYYFHPKRRKFVPYRVQARNAPKKDFISTFNFLREGNNLWMASEFGFIRYGLNSDVYKLYRSDLLEYTLAKDRRGQIWGGGFGQGLVKYNKRYDRFERIPLSTDDRDVIQITPVHKDTIWVHTWSSGIYAVHTSTYGSRSVTILDQKLVRSRISLVDRTGNIWIGSDEGLYQIAEKETVFYDSLSNERVFAIAQDRRGDIWVGTAKGLNRINPRDRSVQKFERQLGLPNDFIYSVQVDRRDNIWLSTNHGISFLDRETLTFRNYTEEDGLQNNEFNGKAGYQDSLGYLYFGGMNGFNIFHPDSIYTNRRIGRTWIEDVRLFDQSIPGNLLYKDTLEFMHDENVIAFDFVSLNYLWPSKNRYQFMLEGFDKEWRPVTRERSTTYTNLPPGTYRFKVRGSNHELLWGDYDEMVIIIRSPWYQTIWFRTLLTLGILLAIMVFFLNKTYQQKRINNRLLTMVEDRTEELNQSNKELNESLVLTQQQKDNISFLMEELNHRVKNNLQLITSLIDIQSLQIRDKQLAIKLKELQSKVFTVARIHDILNQTALQKSVNARKFITGLATDIIAFSGTQVHLNVEVDEIELSTRKLTYMGLVINELITNSLKHAFKDSLSKVIHIYMGYKENKLLLVYRDNGSGFVGDKVDDRYHKGISLIRMLIKDLKGEVERFNDGGAVYRISLEIPVD